MRRCVQTLMPHVMSQRADPSMVPCLQIPWQTWRSRVTESEGIDAKAGPFHLKVTLWLTTGRWSLRTRGRIGRPAAAGTPRPPPAWAAGRECPTSRRGTSEWPARSAERRDEKVANAAKLACLYKGQRSGLRHITQDTFWSQRHRAVSSVWM